ncbi:MAG: exodeoxyribonuclease VII large subunit, partial [Gammaproteobacteria bacterium]|nr:exodeoxyribonuclease VII large subunit [Gammaproteobacteria bacterium]
RLSQRLDDVEQRLHYAWRYSLQQQQNRYQQLRARLLAVSPARLISRHQHQLQILTQNLRHHIQHTLQRQKSRLQNNARTLHAISPLQTLERGYSITCNAEGKAITQSSEVSVGEELQTLLHQGKIVSTVKKILA